MSAAAVPGLSIGFFRRCVVAVVGAVIVVTLVLGAAVLVRTVYEAVQIHRVRPTTTTTFIS
jgi:hypothetical protein